MTWRELLQAGLGLAWLPCLPLLWLQGKWVRMRTPRLSPAAGAETGRLAGSGEPFGVLVFGESTVAGIGASCHELGLAGQLALALHGLQPRAMHWQALGESGVTVAEARQRLLARLTSSHCDCVVLVFGVNDVLRRTSQARWAEDLTQLIADLRLRIGPASIYLAAVPPMGQFPALPQPLRAWLGYRVEKLAATAQALCTSLHDVSYCTTTMASSDGMFCEDRFHPSEAGYRAWAGQLAQLIHTLSLRESKPNPHLESA